MSLSQIAILYTTLSSRKEAIALAECAIREKYAACVNILPGAVSVYEWEGKIEKNKEVLLLFKTTPAKLDILTNWLRKEHPYDVPAILTATVDASAQFGAYVNGAVGKLNDA